MYLKHVHKEELSKKTKKKQKENIWKKLVEASKMEKKYENEN